MHNAMRYVASWAIGYAGGVWVAAIFWNITKPQITGTWAFPFMVTAMCLAVISGLAIGAGTNALIKRLSTSGSENHG